METLVAGYSTWRQRHALSPNRDVIPHLVIAGGHGWRADRLYKAIRASWFSDQIHLLGYVPEKHKGAIYRHAQALIFPSFYEGFGLPVLEAMACGTPVIASFTGSLPEITNHSGILIDPYRQSDLVQALELVNQKNEAAELKKNGLKQSQNFSWSKTAEQTLLAIHS